jgi:hypothetical protein
MESSPPPAENPRWQLLVFFFFLLCTSIPSLYDLQGSCLSLAGFSALSSHSPQNEGFFFFIAIVLLCGGRGNLWAPLFWHFSSLAIKDYNFEEVQLIYFFFWCWCFWCHILKTIFLKSICFLKFGYFCHRLNYKKTKL